MDALKIVSVVFAFAAFGAGIQAARLWHKASRVQIIPMWVNDGRIEPVNPGQAQAEWIVAIIDTANKSGELNRSAAKWTALAVILSTAATLLGSL